MKKKSEKIRDYWNEQARIYGGKPLATTPDDVVRELEINNLAKYILKGKKVLDVGCGNGYSTIRIARIIKSSFTGCDYSKEMIESAKIFLKKEEPEVQKRVDFIEGDVLELPFQNNSFDIVTSDRCLINLIDLKSQIKAAKEICRVLKRSGVYLMCENSQEGLIKLNSLRKCMDLPEISTRWHNLYINERKFFQGVGKFFKLKAIDNFSSTYYIASRVFNAKIAALEGKTPNYHHPLNYMSLRLPAIGDYGQLKIFILIKK